MLLPSILLALSFFAPLSLAIVPPPRSEPLHLPVKRRYHTPRGGELNTAHYSAVSAGLRHKYQWDSTSHSRRAQTAAIPITDLVRQSYLAQQI